jgi:hypothetical protein
MKTNLIHSHGVRRFLGSVAALSLLCGGAAFAQLPAPARAVNPAALPINGAAPSAAVEDIHDIRGPIPIPAPWLWAIWIAGGLAAAGVGYGAWRWLRGRSERELTPFELALARLEAARALMQPGQAEAFSNEVSETMREYIEWRFETRAAHLTTEEFLRKLLDRQEGPLAVHRESVGEFLSICDLAKFARWSLLNADMEAMHESARSFILTTKPDSETTAKAPTPPREPTPLEATVNSNNYATL